MRAALLLAFSLLAACSSADSDGSATRSAGASTKTAGDARPSDSDPGVVAVVSPNGDPSYVCSAEVIAPRVILSAAHCFKGGNYDKTGWTFAIFLGDDVKSPKAADRTVAVREFRVHPNYEASVMDSDIAVAFVDEDLGVAPLPINLDPLDASLVGGAARYVGFGTDPKGRKGKKHTESMQLLSVDPGDVTFTAARTPCHGDSGGPVLVSLGGNETVVAVGHTIENSDENGLCSGVATYLRTDVFADFVRAALSESGS